MDPADAVGESRAVVMAAPARREAARSIVLSTVGSTGDVVPFLALGRRLAARGHRVVIATHDLHRARIEAAGLPHRAVGAPLAVERFNAWMDEAAATRGPLDQLERLYVRLFLRDTGRQRMDQQDVQRGADLVVAHRFDLVAQAVALARGAPYATVTLAPQYLRTRLAPVPGYAPLGAAFADFTWATLDRLVRPLQAKIASELRGHGLSTPPLDPLGGASPMLDLAAASPQLVPPRSDWPRAAALTGAWTLEDPSYAPPAALAEHLDRHPSPVVVGFGSMGGKVAEPTARLVAEALARIGRPAIVQAGWAGLEASGAGVLAVGEVPHGWLFPRAGVVVHHAGAGTTTAVARSGAPSVPVPHLFDQPYWARRLHALGAAARPLPRRGLQAEALAARIVAALEAGPVAGARRLAAAMANEDGAARAVELIEARFFGAGGGFEPVSPVGSVATG